MTSDARIRRRESTLVGVWTAVVLLAIAVPYWDGYRHADPGWHFNGFVGQYTNDYYGYLAWMRQAQDGFLFFKDYYTTEPHGRVFFHPLFWLMGTAARVTGVPLLATWYVVQALACAALIVAVHRFSAHFTSDPIVRALALALVTTSAGFGWLTTPVDATPWIARATDLWLAEANEFRAMATSFFTLPLALTCILLSFLHVLRYVRTQHVREAVAGGLYALALAATHQYDVVTLYAVLGAYALVAARPRLRGLAIVGALSLPYCLYSVAVVHFDPVFALHTKADLPSPTVAAYAVGWGLPLALAVLALVVPGVWRSGRDVAFLATWLLGGLMLLRLPFGFARKLMWGIHVPMCLLAAMLVVWALRVLARSLRLRRPTAIVVTGSLVVTVAAAVGTARFYRELFLRSAPPVVGDYVPEEYVQALHWLDEHTAPEDVVLSSLSIAAMIPGRTGCVVFAGHWAQTVDIDRKAAFIAALFGRPGDLPLATIQRIFARNRVRYIVLDRPAREVHRIPPDRRDFTFSRIAEPVYDNAFVSVWRVSDAGETTAEWDGGDWRGPPTTDPGTRSSTAN